MNKSVWVAIASLTLVNGFISAPSYHALFMAIRLSRAT